MKIGRFVSALVAVALSGVAAESAHAARKAAARPNTHTVTFTITSSQCASVPAGADVQATGIQTDIVREHAIAGGGTRQIVTSHAHGTATDQLGNTYVWSYSFQQNATSTDRQNWTGLVVDHFSLAGSGPVHIVAGFVGSVAFDANTFTITPTNVIGDPIGFDDISPHCDPL
ncbi:hypothetical protein [Piscinibacter sp. XHJ-5]|uniref:hypothetical protein n=1 Tax=Piscinibacter sp. XHJ-5 TaxID=3037797 RepID=UPI0024530E04|nr:hypothetical protein [Piscinibacter sp. XHJ-5]